VIFHLCITCILATWFFFLHLFHFVLLFFLCCKLSIRRRSVDLINVMDVLNRFNSLIK